MLLAVGVTSISEDSEGLPGLGFAFAASAWALPRQPGTQCPVLTADSAVLRMTQ